MACSETFAFAPDPPHLVFHRIFVHSPFLFVRILYQKQLSMTIFKTIRWAIITSGRNITVIFIIIDTILLLLFSFLSFFPSFFLSFLFFICTNYWFNIRLRCMHLIDFVTQSIYSVRFPFSFFPFFSSLCCASII